jgi:hypothetical protein
MISKNFLAKADWSIGIKRNQEKFRGFNIAVWGEYSCFPLQKKRI